MPLMRTLTAVILLVSLRANATILWAGGEDLDFPGGSPVCVSTTATNFRTAFARSAVYPCSTGISQSNPFPGGAVTSVWLSARVAVGIGYNGNRYVGLIKTGTLDSIWVGSDNASSYFAIWKYNGTTWTKLSLAGTIITTPAIYKIDLQVVNYGASGVVNVFIGGQSIASATYTGNLLGASATTLDAAAIGSTDAKVSEVIVSDTDTRALSLATLAPSAAGDTNDWSSGTYSSINKAVNDDTTSLNDTAAGHDFQCNVTDMPAGSFGIVAVKVAARAAKTASGISSLSVGVKTNSTVNAPTASALPLSWGAIETFYPTNPVTSSSWTSTEINALQLNMQTGN